MERTGWGKLRSTFEKHKICSSHTKSLLIQYYQQKNEDFAMERRFVI